MKGHLKHLAMCAPMFVFAAVLIAGGVSLAAALVPVVGCVLMMWVMMRMMGHGSDHSHGSDRSP